MTKLDNNEQAVNLLHNVKGSIENKIRTAYNLGYQDGLKVGKQIVLGAFETYITADRKTEPTSSKMEQVETMSCQKYKHFHKNTVIYLDQCDFCFKDCKYEPKDEPQTIRCPKCGRSDYIREFGKDFSVTAEESGFKYKCINCNTYIEPQSDRKTENSSEKPNNCEPKICDTCRYYNSNIPCGSTPSACKEADKFAEEFVEGLKKLKPTISKMEQVEDEPQTERSE